MSDDLTGSTPPSQPPQAPIFLQSGQGSAASPAPPQPPEKSGADGWPWYFGLLALALGFVAAQVLIAVLLGVWELAGGDYENDSGFVVAASAVQSLTFVAVAVGLARSRGPVSMRDFGLLRARFWPTVGKIVTIMVSYFVILGIYSALVNLKPDDAPEKLGADSGVLGMLLFGMLVAVMAPIVEEIFFRGMIFRSLANGIGVWGGAIVSGVLFGSLHIDSFDGDRLLQVVPLAVLGILFALLYAWSGTLYSTIALHATNNALAVLVYAEKQSSEFGMVLAGVLWLLMMIGCTVGWRYTDRPAPPPPAPPTAMPSPPQQPQHPAPGVVYPLDSPQQPDFPWGQP